MPIRSHRLAPPLFAALCGPLLLDACAQPATTAPVAATQQAVADTTNTDILVDAPWRVQDSDTAIPFQLVIADSSRCLPTQVVLESLRIEVQDNGAWREIYFRDFGSMVANSVEETREMLVVDVRRFAGQDAGLDGKLITARELFGKDMAGEDLQFRATFEASACGKGPDFVVTLRVHVGQAPLPHGHGLFAGWYAGDAHAHTMYTNNFSEFGLPHRSLLSAGHAIGLDWTVTTDHSCDLDDPCTVLGQTQISSRTDVWTHCEETGAALSCTVRDHRNWQKGADHGWQMILNDATDAMQWASPWANYVLSTGEEVTTKSAAGQTVHAIAFGAGYIEAKGSGAPLVECDSVDITVPALLQAAQAGGGMVYAAHPGQSLPSLVNGGKWQDDDVLNAVDNPAFRGFELWNMRMTQSTDSDTLTPGTSGGALDPFPTFTPCSASTECYPYFLEGEMQNWNRWASQRIASGAADPRIFLLGGSDAHGDFNYSTSTSDGMGIGSVTDNAFGKVRNVVRLASLTEAEVLAALREGRVVVTDGPMLAIGFDRTGDGTIEQMDDGQIGSMYAQSTAADLALHLRWQTTAEFGDVQSVMLYRGTGSTAEAPDSYDVLADPEQLGNCAGASKQAADCVVTLAHSGALALPAQGQVHYYYAVAIAGGSGPPRAITNPIWLKGAVCKDADADGFGEAGQQCAELGIQEDCDDTRASVHPGAAEACNGIDDDCDGVVDEGCGGPDSGTGGAGGTGAGGSGGVQDGSSEGAIDGPVSGAPSEQPAASDGGGCSCRAPARGIGEGGWAYAGAVAIAAFGFRRRRKH